MTNGERTTARGLNRRFRYQVGWVGALTALFVISLALPAFTFFSDPADYAVLHLVLEFASMAISIMIIALAWNLRDLEANSQIIVIGFFSVGVLVIDLGHILTFPGMPDFVAAGSAQVTITFWLTGRLIAAIGFVVLALVPNRHWSPRIWVPGLAVTAAACLGFWWIGLVRTEWFPTLFVPGEGITPTKRASEYVLSALYVLAAALLARRAARERSGEMAWLAAAAWTLTLSELYFTLYVDVADTFNLLGHLLKTAAYVMVYRAVFVAGVREPYRRLANESALLRSLIDSVPDLISFTDRSGVFLGANRAFASRVGLPPEAVVGRSPADVMGTSSHGRTRLPPLSDAVERFEEVVSDRDGVVHYLDTLQTPYHDTEGEPLGIIEVSRDMTAQRAADERVRHLALFDQLTGVPNRVMMSDWAAESFAEPGDRTKAVILLDLDDFRTINDTVGHLIGDRIIIETAQRLTSIIGTDASVCRLGGDEFAILAGHCDLEEAAALATTALEAVHRPFRIDDYDLVLTASAGIAMFPTDGLTFDDLSAHADAAMYRAKQEGHNTYRFFSGDMLLRSTEQLALLAALRRAVSEDELVLHYQPQWSLADDTVIGFEALVRWRHPERGLLQPIDFIELAEDSGLILPIGEWVLRRAMADAVRWQDAGGRPVPVAVNVSAVQFLQSDLIELIDQALLCSGLPPERFEVEITESVAMANPGSARAVLEELHGRGISVSIDDFGTGYSSLAYLRRFGIDTLKIDQSFVADLGRDGDNGAIVLAIIEMARALHCATIAEGVETPEQLEFLRSHGCTAAQGFLLGRPVPYEGILPLLRSAGTRDHVVA